MTVKRLGGIILIIVVVITVFHNQFAWLADLLINPSSKVPTIEVPVINQP